MSENYALTSSFKSFEPFPEKVVPTLLIRVAEEHAAAQGDKEWIIDSIAGKGYSYQDFPCQTRNIASGLYKRGFRKGDCAIYCTYEVSCIHIFFTGVWRANGVVRSSYPEDLEETLLGRVKESKAPWILCDELTLKQCLPIVQSVDWRLGIITVGKVEGCLSLQDLIDDDGSACPVLDLLPDDPALILCTSGTTGLSKGAVHSHKSILALLNFRKNFWIHSNGQPNLFICKGTHVRGATGPLGTMIIGTPAIVMSKITKEIIFNAVHKYQPIYIHGMSSHILLLVNEPDANKIDRTSIKAVFGGGGIISKEIEESFMKLPNVEVVINGYGLTETVFSVNNIDLDCPEMLRKIPETPPMSIGKVGPDCELRIRDVETGSALGPGERGEICVKNPNMFSYYVNQPEATAAAFENGWFLTGDLGYYDEAHFVFVIDRVKETFKYFGNHISPFEIESIILQYDGVNEACVVGIPENGGFVPRAFLTVKPNTTIDPKEIEKFANAKLASYKHIRGGVFIIDELPKGSAGKVARHLLCTREMNF